MRWTTFRFSVGTIKPNFQRNPTIGYFTMENKAKRLSKHDFIV